MPMEHVVRCMYRLCTTVLRCQNSLFIVRCCYGRIFLAGGLLMSLAPGMAWLVPARFVTGFASGLSTVLVPVYLGEMAPPTMRGTLGTLSQFAMVIGILASDLLAFPLATEQSWRYLFAVTPILAFVQVKICTMYIYDISTPMTIAIATTLLCSS